MPTLILNFPEGQSTTFAVAGEIVTLGRARHNDICIPERHVSSVHAEFRKRRDGAYELVDLGSLNGTYVNGVRLTERHGLHEGDRIVFGILEAKLTHAHPEQANAELTRGLEIDFLRAAEAIRLNPDLAQVAVELQRQIDHAKAALHERSHGAPGQAAPEEILRELQRQLEEANAKLASLQAVAPPRTPAPLPVASPARNPTIQLVTPGRTGRNRQILVEVQSPTPPPAKSSEQPPDAFLPAPPHPAPPPERRSPFSVAPPEGGQSAAPPTPRPTPIPGANGKGVPPRRPLLNPHPSKPGDRKG